MAHIRTSENEIRREGSPHQVGTPANFVATCIANPGKTVVCFCDVAGFVVPAAGAWFVNRLHAPAGLDRDLKEGDRVTYHDIKGDPAAHFAPRLRNPNSFANCDPSTLRPLPAFGPRRQ